MGFPGSSGGPMYLKGFEQVMSNLNKEIKGIVARSTSGLVHAVYFIRTQTETKYPKTPVDYGNLRSSWFVTAPDGIKKGNNPTFIGPKSGIYSTDHVKMLNESQGVVAMNSSAFKKIVMFGYSVNYAGFIHEMIVAQHFTRKQSDIKWLEVHINNNTKALLEIIRKHAVIK